MATTITFPESFEQKLHSVVPGATQWLIKDSKGKNTISIVGGGFGLHGDGVKTFEMYDFREDNPQGYLSKEDINNHLESHPIL